MATPDDATAPAAALANTGRRSFRPGPGRIAGIYALLASAWILASDRLVARLDLSPIDTTRLATAKGWLFVAVTTAILYRMMKAMVRDITRMHAEIAREQGEKLRTANLLQAIADGSTDAIYAKDSAGRYLLCNREAVRLAGKEAGEIIGRDDRALFPAETAAAVMADDRAVLERGAVVTFEEAVATPYGIRIMLTTKGPIHDGGRRPVGLFGVSRDITERAAATNALRERNAQLAQSNADLEQFAYVASHDLREPLRMVSAYVGLLERRYGPSLDAPALEYIAFAREGAQRLDRMVLDLLDFSRAGKRAEPFAPVDLGEVVRTACANLAAAVAEAGATLDIAADLPAVMGSRGDLVRLIQNLIGNALKYHAPDRPPRIGVTCSSAAGEWRIAVSDNGIGIEPQYFTKIFAIFQRLHTRDRYDGTGIGLAICRRIVHYHGGRIWVESTPGTGSTFHFTLPKEAPAPESGGTWAARPGATR